MSAESYVETSDENAHGFCLQYSIVVTRDPFAADPNLVNVYSLMIVKFSHQNEVESYFAYDISRDGKRALKISDMMQKNSVTPCVAAEILDTLL